MKIEKLTKEQEADLISFRKEWLNHGLNNQPADRATAEDNISVFYEKLGKKKPIFLWFTSPFIANLAINFLTKLSDQLLDQLSGQLLDQLNVQLREQLRGQLSDQLLEQLRGQLYAQLLEQLRGQLYAQLLDQLGGQLNNQLLDQLGGQLLAQLREQLRGQLYAQLREQYVYTYFWGQQDSFWIAFYLFAAKIGVRFAKENLELLNNWSAISRSTSWWWPYENICIMSERHTYVEFDNQNRLHCLKDKAVSFSDGWGVYAIHGIRFDEKLFKKVSSNSLTAKEILKIKNVDQRAIALKIRGAEKLLEELDAKLIDRSKRGNYLYKLENVFSQDAYFLKFACPSTGKVYVHGVDPEFAKDNLNADACVARTGRMDLSQYQSLRYEA